MHWQRRIFACLVMALTCLLASVAGAFEPYSLANTEVRELPRSANGRDYTLYISLPSSYASSPSRTYPVLYCCDGYWSFSQIIGLYFGLRADNVIPECIIVGMAYSGTAPAVGSLRQWDLTPSSDSWADPSGSNSGHAREYLDVIASEFIPFVQAQYRADPSYRVLSGSSYGGLFTLFALFERPGLFQGYVVPSPSLWWNNGYIQRMERAYAQTHRSLPARLFMSYAADEGDSIRTTTKDFAGQLRSSGYTDFAMAIREIVGERHSTTACEAYNRGLRFAFLPLSANPPTSYDPGFDSFPTLGAISTRGLVRSGENALIAGIVVQGLVPKRVLVRAVGPALAGMGIANPLSDPKLSVINANQQLVATNDNWEDQANASEVSSTGIRLGLYAFTAGSRDASTIVTLAPGNYTVVVESVNGAEGIALVEVYEVH